MTPPLAAAASAGIVVPLRRLDPGVPLPAYAHPDDAGADLHAAAATDIPPGEWRLVGTGVAIALPPGFAAFVHPRSGLAARSGVTTLNAPGTVDAGYRGEIVVNLVNHGPAPFTVRPGDRIAQLVVQRVERAVFAPVDALPESVRGTAGHGSTGGHETLRSAGRAAPPPVEEE